jgi:hypothetical protein
LPLRPCRQGPQSTPRLETGPYYGATVTVEEGVRVFRPLPPHGRFIIKADGTDALSLGSSQLDNCACNRTYLHHVGETAGSSRYLRRIGETQPLSGPR